MGNDVKKKAHCVVVFESHEDAEKALLELQRAGYDMGEVSMLGPHTEGHAVVFSGTGDRVKCVGTGNAPRRPFMATDCR